MSPVLGHSTALAQILELRLRHGMGTTADRHSRM
jgi:hypothetical protein